MNPIVAAALVVVVIVAVAGAYVFGFTIGSTRAEHPDGPQTCQAKLAAAETMAQMWRTRAVQLEEENDLLMRDMAEVERGVTATAEILLSEIDKAIETGTAQR